MMTWQGSRKQPVDFAQVEASIVEAHARFNFTLRLDPWQALDLAQRLRARGIVAAEFSFTTGSKQRLAQTLLSTINTGNLRLYAAEGLRAELLALRLTQSTSGAWGFDHRSGGHDDRAVALSLLAVALLDLARSAEWVCDDRGDRRGRGRFGRRGARWVDGRSGREVVVNGPASGDGCGRSEVDLVGDASASSRAASTRARFPRKPRLWLLRAELAG